MLTGPIPATQYALDKTGLSIDDIDTVEINEAFAPVVMAWLKETKADHGEGQPQRRRDRARTPAGCDRGQAVHHDAEHVGAHRRSLRTADDVRGRRHRQRHHHRTPLVVVEDHATDVAAGEHVVVGLVDVVQLVLGGDRLVEEQLPVAIEVE